MEFSDELPPRYTDVQEAHDFLCSQEYFAALNPNTEPLSDLDIIKIANALYEKNNSSKEY